MKIRNGFVSNSSSSSFLVKFPREPKTVNDVRKMLFGDKTLFVAPYSDMPYPVDQIAKTVFDDIQSQSKNDINGAIEFFTNSNSDGGPNYDNYKTGRDWNSVDWGAYNKDRDEWAEKKFEEFYSLKKIRKEKLEKLDGKDVVSSGEVFYMFEYGDDSSYFAALEHGDLFENLEHVINSNH